jgi:hypothetical protein
LQGLAFRIHGLAEKFGHLLWLTEDLLWWIRSY